MLSINTKQLIKKPICKKNEKIVHSTKNNDNKDKKKPIKKNTKKEKSCCDRNLVKVCI